MATRMGRVSDLITLARETVYRVRTRRRREFHNGRAEALAILFEHSLREAKRIAFRQNSAIVVSQPKSGRTWLRFMLDRLGLHLRYQHPSGSILPDEWRGKKIIFLYRDPRDVVVSHWYHATRRHGFYDGSLSDFILHPEWGLESVIRSNLYWKSVVDASVMCPFLRHTLRSENRLVSRSAVRGRGSIADSLRSGGRFLLA